MAHRFRQFGALTALAITCPALAYAQWQGPPERHDLPAGATIERAPRTDQTDIRAAREALAALTPTGNP